MSEPLRTFTERCRDQRRIEALEAELRRAQIMQARAEAEAKRLASAYTDALEALTEAHEWRGVAVLMALLGGCLAIFAIRAFSL